MLDHAGPYFLCRVEIDRVWVEPTLAPPAALGITPVLDFLFWSRKVFVEAGHRRMFVYAVGE